MRCVRVSLSQLHENFDSTFADTLEALTADEKRDKQGS